MKNWRVELTAGGNSLAKIKIQRGIFQGDALSPLLFIIVRISLNYILRKCTAWYKLSRSQEKINHLMYLDIINLFAKSEKKMETLIHTVGMYSQEKWQTTSNWQDRTIKSVQDETARRKRDLQILRNVGVWHHQTSGNEKQNWKWISQEN